MLMKSPDTLLQLRALQCVLMSAVVIHSLRHARTGDCGTAHYTVGWIFSIPLTLQHDMAAYITQQQWRHSLDYIRSLVLQKSLSNGGASSSCCDYNKSLTAHYI